MEGRGELGLAKKKAAVEGQQKDIQDVEKVLRKRDRQGEIFRGGSGGRVRKKWGGAVRSREKQRVVGEKRNGDNQGRIEEKGGVWGKERWKNVGVGWNRAAKKVSERARL